MSEREFEIFLELLSKLLQLSPAQQAEITDELRDHLEQRFSELLRQGHTREGAIRQAVDEFGDAAGLAYRFSQLSQLKRRRVIMRRTLGSIVATTVVFGLIYSIMPAGAPVIPPQIVVAQSAPPIATPPQGTNQSAKGPGGMAIGMLQHSLPIRKSSAADDAVRAKVFTEEPVDVEFLETPLNEAVQRLSREWEIPFILDKAGLEEANVAPDAPISFSVSGILRRNVLKLLVSNFEQPGPNGLVIEIRYGVLRLTTRARSMYVAVYNCQDLLGMTPAAGMAAGGMPGMGAAGGMPHAPMGGMMMGPMGGFGGGGMAVASSNEGRQLTEAIMRSVGNEDTWLTGGGSSSIQEFSGLLIVRASADHHAEIAEVLSLIREALHGTSDNPVQ